MALSLSPYLASLMLCLAVAVYAWRRSSVIGARSYALTAAGQAIWIVGYILELVSQRVEVKVLWDAAQWIGTILVSVAWIMFVLDYTGRSIPHRVRLWAALLSLPVIAWGILTTGIIVGAFRTDAQLIDVPPFGGLTYRFGPLDMVLTLYIYALTILGIFLMGNHLRRVRAIYRLQTAIILVGFLIPIIGSFAIFTDIDILGQRDLAPITFSLSNLLIMAGLFRYGLFDLVPIAREAVVESMTDSVVVVDAQNRIVDINQTGLSGLRQTASDVLGKPIIEVYAIHASLVERFLNVNDTHTELEIVEPDGTTRHIDFRISPVIDKRGKTVGRVFVSRDITALKQTQQAEHEQRKIAEGLMNIALTLNSTLDVNEVLERILVNIEQMIGYSWGEVISIHRGLVRIERPVNPALSLPGEQLWPLQHTNPIKRMSEQERACLIPDTLDSPDWTPIEGLMWVRSFLGMPIVIEEEIIGFINLASDQPGSFSETDAQRLEVIAGQAAIAIRNAKAYQQAQSLGMLQERQRLARELHDSVSQTVFAATTMAELLPQVRHDSEKLDRYITEVGMLTRSAMAEMRILMTELQPDAITRTEFTVLLKNLCDALSGSIRIPVEISTSGRVFLEPRKQTAYYRIAQEAINNIQFHAQASKVSLRFEQTGDHLELRICDNGCGFDSAAPDRQGRGILLMREQAARIGAHLEISSQAGNGTEVIVTGA